MSATTNKLTIAPTFEPLEPRLLLDGENPILAQVNYLIIAADCFLQHPKVIELADWKQSKGFRTKTVSMSYIESYAEFYSLPITDAIRNYIASGWSKPGEEYWETPPKYVLLVGGDDGDEVLEDNEVPADTDFCLNDYPQPHVSDNPYADLDGEYYSALDVAIGRIPLSTVDDVTMAINKILTYDRTPDVPGPEEVNWYANALVAATYLGRIEENNPTDVYETGGYFMETAHRVADFIGQDYDFWDDQDPLNPGYHAGYNVYTALAATQPGLGALDASRALRVPAGLRHRPARAFRFDRTLVGRYNISSNRGAVTEQHRVSGGGRPRGRASLFCWGLWPKGKTR